MWETRGVESLERKEGGGELGIRAEERWSFSSALATWVVVSMLHEEEDKADAWNGD